MRDDFPTGSSPASCERRHGGDGPGLAALSFLGKGTGVPRLVLCLAVVGVGFSLFSSPNTNAVMGSVPSRDYGMASGVIATMRLAGQAFSMAAVFVLLGVIMGRASLEPSTADAFMNAMHYGFLFFFALSVLGVFASLARGDLRGR